MTTVHLLPVTEAAPAMPDDALIAAARAGEPQPLLAHVRARID